MVMTVIQLNSIYRQADNIVTRKVMDETLLVPISGDIASMDEIYTLNDTGAFIWQALDGKSSLAEIGEQLAKSFDAEYSVVETDLLEIIGELAEAGLVAECIASPERTA